MIGQYLSKTSMALFQACLVFFLFQPSAGGEQSTGSVWQSIETRHTIIHYRSQKDLEKLNSKVKFGERGWGLERLFSESEGDDLVEKVRKKADLLFERVQEILDMRRKMRKVAIRVYPDKTQLQEAFTAIYGKSRRLRAWYIYEYNTVYLNAGDLHERMLAHEMAHAIIDNYLTVRPPSATAEILARYVDSHLHD